MRVGKEFVWIHVGWVGRAFLIFHPFLLLLRSYHQLLLQVPGIAVVY